METCSGSSFAENGGDGSALGAAFPARAEQRDRRVPEGGALGSVRADPRRRQDAVSGVPATVLERRGEGRRADRAVLALGERRREADCGSEPERRPGPRAAGAGEHLHARGGRHEHHGVGRQGRHRGREHGLGADVGRRSSRRSISWRKPAAARAAPNNCFGANCPGAWGWSSPYLQYGRRVARLRRNRCATSSTRAPRRSTSAATRRLPPRVSSVRARRLRLRRGHCRTAAAKRRSSSHENVLDRHEHARRQDAGAARSAWPTETYFDEFYKLSEYVNGEAVILYHAPGGEHRRRQLRVLPAFGSDQRRQPLLDRQLPADRHRQGRQHSGRDRRPESHPRPRGGRIPVAGRHVDYSGPRAAVGHRRRRLVSQHAGDDPRSRPRPEEKRHDARAGEGGAARPWTSTAGTAPRRGDWTTEMFVEAVYKSLQEKK